MNEPDSGADQLFRRATADLHPETDRLVAGGIARGRGRRRRHLVGTAVAVLAVIGILGVGAVAVPPLDALEQTPVATDPSPSPPPPTPTSPSPASPSPTPPTVTEGASPSAPGRITVAAEQVPATVEQLLGRSGAGPVRDGSSYPVISAEDQLVVHYMWEGTLATLVIVPGTPQDNCARGCEEVDGLVQRVGGPDTADGVTTSYVTVWRDGFRIDALSYNAAEGKDVEPVTAEPPLSHDDLLTIARSPVWFS
jgi:hypothetical protein